MITDRFHFREIYCDPFWTVTSVHCPHELEKSHCLTENVQLQSILSFLSSSSHLNVIGQTAIGTIHRHDQGPAADQINYFLNILFFFFFHFSILFMTRFSMGILICISLKLIPRITHRIASESFSSILS